MSRAVHDMFASIARRYDLTNDVLSFGVHRLWRKRACDFAALKSGESVLDLCTGTGEVASEAALRVGSQGCVYALDFVSEMLALGKLKVAGRANAQSATIHFLRGDAGQIPVTESAVDAVTIAYGIRNVDDPRSCLREIRRVLRPGGRAVILEFGQPTVPFFAALFKFYSFRIMPLLGGMLTGNKAAYEYLPKTSASFPAGDSFVAMMVEAQFSDVSCQSLMFGATYVYRGVRPR